MVKYNQSASLSQEMTEMLEFTCIIFAVNLKKIKKKLINHLIIFYYK